MVQDKQTSSPSRRIFQAAMIASPQIRIRQPLLPLPAVSGVIERRILVNYRCAADTLARILPAPFRPKLIHGWGMAGICLIRLGRIHPAFLPDVWGLASENAAHRIAVEWEAEGKLCEGVYIPRRDTDSLLNHLAGGRVFPGEHHAADFQVWETGDRFKLELRSRDGKTHVHVLARITTQVPVRSIFTSLEEASAFFRSGSLGWSARREEGSFDGLELHCPKWELIPLEVERVESSFFEDDRLFPMASTQFDSAFLMRNVPHEWHAKGRLTTHKRTGP